MSVEAIAWAAKQKAGSAGAKLTLVALANYANDDCECWPSQRTLSRWTEAGERTIRRHLADLEALGLIEREQRHEQDGRYQSSIIRLNIQRPNQPAAKMADGQIGQQPAAKLAANPKESNRHKETSTPSGVLVVAAAEIAPKKASKQAPPTPVQELVDLYHETLPELAAVRALTQTRRSLLKTRWREHPDLDYWAKFFAYVRTCPFLMGQVTSRDGRPPFQADLEWLIRPTNYVKVIEGKYDGGAA